MKVAGDRSAACSRRWDSRSCGCTGRQSVRSARAFAARGLSSSQPDEVEELRTLLQGPPLQADPSGPAEFRELTRTGNKGDRKMDFKTLFRPGILATRPYSTRTPVKEVQRELGLDKVVKLASNENPEGPLPAVVEAIRRPPADINRYPDASCYELTRNLATHLGVHAGRPDLRQRQQRGHRHPHPGPGLPRGEHRLQPPQFHRLSPDRQRPFRMRPADPAEDRGQARPAGHGGGGRRQAPSWSSSATRTIRPAPTTRSLNSAPSWPHIPENVIVAVDEAYYEYVTAEDYPADHGP